MSKKVCAVIFALSNYKEKFPFWYHNSISSFKKWHPDIELKVIEDGYEFTNKHHYMPECIIDLMKHQGYTKVIKIDSDGIICGRFDEILKDDDSPIITTSCRIFVDDADTQQHQAFMLPNRSILNFKNINAGIYCVNSLECIQKVFDMCKSDNTITDEQALRKINRDPNTSSIIRVVDFPYGLVPYVYNMRFHCMSDFECDKPEGVTLSCDNNSPLISYLSPFNRLFVHNGMLLNHDGKQIKFFHNFHFKKAYDVIMGLDDHVKKFFTEECNCDLNLEYCTTQGIKYSRGYEI